MASVPPSTNTSIPSLSQPFVNGKGIINQAWLYFLQVLFSRTGGTSGTGAVFTGTILDFAGPAVNIPLGYLACDGSAVSRGTYAGLFTAIGTTWGAGDGATTFNLPNLNGVFTQGGTPGATGGNATVTLTIDQMPAHSHPVTDPGHTHSTAVTASSVTAGAAAGGAAAGTTGFALTGIGIGPSGGGDPFSIIPPFAQMLKIIKT